MENAKFLFSKKCGGLDVDFYVSTIKETDPLFLAKFIYAVCEDEIFKNTNDAN